MLPNALPINDPPKELINVLPLVTLDGCEYTGVAAVDGGVYCLCGVVGAAGGFALLAAD